MYRQQGRALLKATQCTRMGNDERFRFAPLFMNESAFERILVVTEKLKRSSEHQERTRTQIIPIEHVALPDVVAVMTRCDIAPMQHCPRDQSATAMPPK